MSVRRSKANSLPDCEKQGLQRRVCEFIISSATMSFLPDTIAPKNLTLVESLRSHVASGSSSSLDDTNVLTILKDGVWHPYGECVHCNLVGPRGFHCQNKQCVRLGLLYWRGLSPYMCDGAVNQGRLTTLADIVHTTLAAEPDLEAARIHFLLLLASLWCDAFPQHVEA
jgi:hypothetical protein